MAWTCSCGNVNTSLFCPCCGSVQHQLDKPKSLLSNSRASAGLLVGISVISIAIWLALRGSPPVQESSSSGGPVSSTPLTQEPRTTPASASAPDGAIAQLDAVVDGKEHKSIHFLGEDVLVGYWSYRCDRVSCYLSDIVRPNAAFLVIDITVRNNDESSSTLPPLRLLDPEGRLYDSSSEATIRQGFLGPLESLNPGVSKNGRVAFDVPHNRDYSLVVSGGYQSVQRATIVLSERPDGTERELKEGSTASATAQQSPVGTPKPQGTERAPAIESLDPAIPRPYKLDQQQQYPYLPQRQP